MILLWPFWPAWVDLFLNYIRCGRWGPSPQCSTFYLNSFFFLWMLCWVLLLLSCPPRAPSPPFFHHTPLIFFELVFPHHHPLYNVWVKLNFQHSFKSGFKIKQNKFSCALSMAMAHLWVNERRPFVKECCDINKKRKFLGGACRKKVCLWSVCFF